MDTEPQLDNALKLELSQRFHLWDRGYVVEAFQWMLTAEGITHELYVQAAEWILWEHERLISE